MSDGDNEFPLVIESNSDDHIDQKRFIPASELLKRSKVSSLFLRLSSIVFQNQDYGQDRVNGMFRSVGTTIFLPGHSGFR